MAGKDGEICNVEVAASSTDGFRCGIVLPENDVLAHSNHYLTHYLQPYCQNDQSSFPDSWLREYRMRQLMNNHYGELTPEIFMNEILLDHRGYPDSICRHCDLTGPIGEQFDTVFSCVAVPEDGKLWTVNNPCQNPYKLYTL